MIKDHQILRYEREFFSASFCKNRANLERRLADDFIEYGSSGAVHDRVSMIDALSGIVEDRLINIERFEVVKLSDAALLVRYISHDLSSNAYALRSSIWKLVGDEWKMSFHQGTPITKH